MFCDFPDFSKDPAAAKPAALMKYHTILSFSEKEGPLKNQPLFPAFGKWGGLSPDFFFFFFFLKKS